MKLPALILTACLVAGVAKGQTNAPLTINGNPNGLSTEAWLFSDGFSVDNANHIRFNEELSSQFTITLATDLELVATNGGYVVRRREAEPPLTPQQYAASVLWVMHLAGLDDVGSGAHVTSNGDWKLAEGETLSTNLIARTNSIRKTAALWYEYEATNANGGGR